MFSKIFIASLLVTASLAADQVKYLEIQGFDSATDLDLLAKGKVPDGRLIDKEAAEDVVKAELVKMFGASNFTVKKTCDQIMEAVKKCNGDRAQLTGVLANLAKLTLNPQALDTQHETAVRAKKAELENTIATTNRELRAAEDEQNFTDYEKLTKELKTHEQELEFLTSVLDDPVKALNLVTGKLSARKRQNKTLLDKISSKTKSGEEVSPTMKNKLEKTLKSATEQKNKLENWEKTAKQVVNERAASWIAGERTRLEATLSGADGRRRYNILPSAGAVRRVTSRGSPQGPRVCRQKDKQTYRNGATVYKHHLLQRLERLFSHLFHATTQLKSPHYFCH